MKQVSIKGMLEFTASCGFLFAVAPSRDFVLYGIVCAVLAIWSMRVSRWELRWLLCNWLVACGSLCLGLACLEHSFLAGADSDHAAHFWLHCGCALIVWAPLAGVNGFLFLAEWLRADRPHPSRTRWTLQRPQKML